jgi:hypothetical protein
MNKYKIGQLQFNPSYKELPSGLKTEELRGVAERFVRNLERIDSLGNTPVGLFYGGAILGRSYILAYQEVTKKQFPLHGNPETTDDENREIDSCQLALVMTEFSKFDDIQQQVRAHNETAANLENLKLPIVTPLSQSIEAILAASIIGTWTAFEVLATDLWITAVNSRPMTLGVTALLGMRWSDRNSSASLEVNENQNRAKDSGHKRERHTPMNLDILKRYKFNLGSSLGTMIHEEQKYNFNLLEGIKQAYEQTFAIARDSACAVRPEVRTWFSGDDYCKLEALEAIRHVYAHRAGHADSRFWGRINGKYKVSCDADQRIELDGASVVDLADAAVRRASMLLKGVDQWTDNP